MKDYMAETVLKISGLIKTYKKGVVALDGLDLEIQEGALFGFVGPNGAGKSTTINILVNILKKDSGTIELFGEAITETSFDYKAKTGFLLEKPVYIDKLSVKEYLEFAGQMYGLENSVSEKRSKELIAFFELQNKRNELIETYSSGMKKTVSLAPALIHQPDILVLDEPFEGMDAIAIKKTKQLFLDLKNKGTTILITSHILSYVENICDEVAIINKGKIVYQNTTENIRNGFKEKMKEDAKLSALEEVFLSVVDEENNNQTLSWVEEKS